MIKISMITFYYTLFFRFFQWFSGIFRKTFTRTAIFSHKFLKKRFFGVIFS